MRKSVPIAVVLCLSFLASPLLATELPTAKPEQVGLSSERLERIGQVLQADVESGRMRTRAGEWSWT